MLSTYTCQAYTPMTFLEFETEGKCAEGKREGAGEETEHQDIERQGAGLDPHPLAGKATSLLPVLRVRGLRAALSDVLRGAWPARPRASPTRCPPARSSPARRHRPCEVPGVRCGY